MANDLTDHEIEPGYTASQLEGYVEQLKFVTDRLEAAIKMMRHKEFDDLHLKAKSAFGIYLETLVSIAGKAESEVIVQAKHSIDGTTPPWAKNKIKVIKREIATAVIADGIVKSEKPISAKSSRKRATK